MLTKRTTDSMLLPAKSLANPLPKFIKNSQWHGWWCSITKDNSALAEGCHRGNNGTFRCCSIWSPEIFKNRGDNGIGVRNHWRWSSSLISRSCYTAEQRPQHDPSNFSRRSATAICLLCLGAPWTFGWASTTASELRKATTACFIGNEGRKVQPLRHWR